MRALLAWMSDAMRRLLFLPPEASTRAASLDHLHFLVIGTTTTVALAIALVTAYFAWRYRRRPGDTGHSERVVAPLWLELGVYGAILAAFLLFWAIGIRQYLDMARPPDGALEVYVTAKQWMWKFAYPNGAGSVGELYVPAGRPVRLLLTSRDVIHSFFVPDFRLKRDAVPGRYTGLWFEAPEPGRHDVLCAEMCGTGHSRMRGDVVVLPPEEFAAWLEGRTAAPGAGEKRAESLAELGRRAAQLHGCFQCHSSDGSKQIGPTWKGLFGSTVALQGGGRTVADEAYLTESMMDPRAKIVKSFAPVMPSFQGQLDSADAAAIVEFIKSLSDAGGAAAARRAAGEGAP